MKAKVMKVEDRAGLLIAAVISVFFGLVALVLSVPGLIVNLI